MFKYSRRNQLSLSLALGMALTLVAGFNSSAVAQTRTDEQGYQSNEKDPLYGDAPGGLNPMDLMHRAQQLNGPSAAEFNQESQVRINNSVSDFKRLQQQRILEQQQSTPTTEPVETLETVE
ncbi:MAG: hypothetical protein ACFCU7_17725 [Pleurocapsa sp.]